MQIDSKARLTNVAVTGSMALYEGGFIYAKTRSEITGYNLQISKAGTFHTVKGKGGSFYLSDSKLTLEKSSITSSQSCKGGGLFTDRANVDLKSSKFNKNLATNEGSVMYLFASRVTISQSELS